jgi:hypothetical protein
MENPLIRTLLPKSLVMRRDTCDYCGANNTKCNYVESMYGIKACDIHVLWGLRDCRAYMHEHKYIITKDAYSNTILSKFMEHLQGFIPVRRTNGTIELDWKTNQQIEWLNRSMILFSCIENIWCIFVTNDICHKYINIYDFSTVDIRESMKNPPGISLIQSVENVLNGGLYKEYWLERESLIERPMLINDDDPFIKTTKLYKNGSAVNVRYVDIEGYDNHNEINDKTGDPD